MIFCDVNILIYAHDVNFKHHLRVKSWLEEQISSTNSVYFSWQTLTGFVRITTNSKLFINPLTEEKAVEKVSKWLERPNVSILVETERHWDILRNLILDYRIKAGDVMDAHLAAMAIEHGVILATTDRDFAVFKGLRTLNPLDL